MKAQKVAMYSQEELKKLTQQFQELVVNLPAKSRQNVVNYINKAILTASTKPVALNVRLARVARVLERMEKTSAKWESKPKGWTKGSMDKYWDTLTGDAKHKTTKCIKKMEGIVDDPGAFCAAMRDRLEGKKWRSER